MSNDEESRAGVLSRSLHPAPLRVSHDVFARVAIDPDTADLVPAFLARRRSELVSLMHAFGRSDYDALRKSGHNLVGSGAGYGFPRLSELGAELSAAARDKDRAALAAKRPVTLPFARMVLRERELFD